MEYFYDKYSGITMLKAGIEDFAYWYGDKAYRQFDVVADIQRELLQTIQDELIYRIGSLTNGYPEEYSPGYREGVIAAEWVVANMFKEIDEKDLTPDDDCL